MARNFPLIQSGSAVADANGNAVVEMRPGIAGEWWRVRNTSVSGNSSNEPVVKIYKGFVSDACLIGGSLTGNLDSANGDDYIQPNEAIICVWSQATPGASFTVTITGERGRNGIF